MARLALSICAAAVLAGLALAPERAAAVTMCLAQEDVGAAGLPCVANKDEVYDGVVMDNGGNDKEDHVEAVLGYIFGTPFDIMPAQTNGGDDLTDLEGDFMVGSGGVDFTPNGITGGTSFDWSYSGPSDLAFITVKASNSFALFQLAANTTSGSISLDGLIPHNVSHVGFWKLVNGVVTPAPEPASLGLLAMGLVGLAVARRSRRRA